MKKDLLKKFEERPSLRHLKRLTTKGGLIQHADLEVPDPSFGYSIDDNARGLIVCLWHHKIFNDPALLQLAEIYFNYLKKVVKEGGSFHNFLSFSEKLLDSEGSEDSIGRAIWALGEVVGYGKNTQFAHEAKEMIGKTHIDKHLEHSHIRSKAYISLGLMAAGMKEEAKPWIDQLVECYKTNRQENWKWFEDGLYYANGILPYALTKASSIYNDKEIEDIAIESFNWLNEVSKEDNYPAPIGQNGWYKKGEEKALYDQQPLEAADMIITSAELYNLTKDKLYLDKALEWYGWYEGNNTKKERVIDSSTDGIFDGVTHEGINKNQGAESIVTYLMAYLKLSEISINE